MSEAATFLLGYPYTDVREVALISKQVLQL